MPQFIAVVVKADGTSYEFGYKDLHKDALPQTNISTIATVPGLPNIAAYAEDNAVALGLPLNYVISNAIRDAYPYGILGDVIFPKMTDGKRAKLHKLGILHD